MALSAIPPHPGETKRREGLGTAEVPPLPEIRDHSLQAEKIRGHFEAIDLAQYTTQLAETFRPAVERAGLVFRIDSALVSEPVYVDREKWRAIVFGLISNAFKHTFAGSITVSLRQRGRFVHLSVHDTGVGIPDHKLDRLLEHGEPIEGVPGRAFDGMAAELSVVQEFVRIHGGSFEALSQTDWGSTFTVRIPRGHAHLPVER